MRISAMCVVIKRLKGLKCVYPQSGKAYTVHPYERTAHNWLIMADTHPDEIERFHRAAVRPLQWPTVRVKVKLLCMLILAPSERSVCSISLEKPIRAPCELLFCVTFWCIALFKIDVVYFDSCLLFFFQAAPMELEFTQAYRLLQTVLLLMEPPNAYIRNVRCN